MIDLLWQQRNTKAFKDQNWSKEDIMVWLHKIELAWNHATKNQEGIIKNRSNNICSVNKFTWSPSEGKQFTLNCDGARSRANAVISCGGLLRNDANDSMASFACNLRVSSVIQ